MRQYEFAEKCLLKNDFKETTHNILGLKSFDFYKEDHWELEDIEAID